MSMSLMCQYRERSWTGPALAFVMWTEYENKNWPWAVELKEEDRTDTTMPRVVHRLLRLSAILHQHKGERE